MIKLPFYHNPGRHCGQAVMKIALKAIMPEKDFSYEELDKITMHDPKEWTSPPQLALGFIKLGVNFEYYIKPGFEKVSIPNYARDYAAKNFKGNYMNTLFKRVNFKPLEESVALISGDKRVIEREQDLTIKDLEKVIDNENIPICWVNYSLFIHDKEPNLSGHFLIMTGYDKDSFFYINTDNEFDGENVKGSKETFNKAWNLCFFDHGLMVVNRKQ